VKCLVSQQVAKWLVSAAYLAVSIITLCQHTIVGVFDSYTSPGCHKFLVIIIDTNNWKFPSAVILWAGP